MTLPSTLSSLSQMMSFSRYGQSSCHWFWGMSAYALSHANASASISARFALAASARSCSISANMPSKLYSSPIVYLRTGSGTTCTQQ
eukprot:7388498-Prymnesium_polylepis.1